MSADLLSCWCSFISIDGSEAAAPEISQRDADAIARTRACVEGCRIDEVSAFSRFLPTVARACPIPRASCSGPRLVMLQKLLALGPKWGSEALEIFHSDSFNALNKL